jgi:hypothetical protein
LLYSDEMRRQHHIIMVHHISGSVARLVLRLVLGDEAIGDAGEEVKTRMLDLLDRIIACYEGLQSGYGNILPDYCTPFNRALFAKPWRVVQYKIYNWDVKQPVTN